MKHQTTPARVTLASMALLLSCGTTAAAAAADVPPSIDLTTAEGVSMVRGQWRYSDAHVVEVPFRAPDAEGQPTGAPIVTQQIEPAAGLPGFDDSHWTVIEPGSLAARRGSGHVSFNWYRINLTVPEQVGDFDTRGATVWFQTRVDDYAEVWVDGELARAYGQSGGSVVAGWNAPNRLIVARNVRPGQQVQIAVFGINGPISDAPTNYIYLREARVEFTPGTESPVAVTPQEVNVRVVRKDPAIDAIVPLNAKLYKVAEGFAFTEGPVWVNQGGYLLFSDPNRNTIYRYDDAHGLSVFREKSGYDAADIGEYGQPGSNGLTLDLQGRLTVNEHGRHRVTRLEIDGSLTVLTSDYRGKRLNSPNDLVYRSDGALYFTDPPFGLPKFFDDPRKQLPFSGVYRWKDGHVTLLTTELKGPNGIAFSPDEKFLYVDNWDPARKVVLRFPVKRDGTLGLSTMFADLTSEVPGEEALDGLKVDVEGHLYVSAPDGLRIYASDGRHLGTIRGPRTAHNFAWGGPDGKTLYLCARSALYRIDLKVAGVRP
jgi:gluconolactonase